MAWVERKFRNQKVLRASLRRRPIRRGPRACLFYLVRVPDNISRWAYPHGKFLFSLRTEKPHVPIPDVQLRRHHLVRLLQPQFALQVRLRIVVHAEHNRRPVAAHVFAQPRHKAFCPLLRLPTRDAEIHGSFRKRPKEILVSENRSDDSERNPQQQRPLLRPAQPIAGHSSLRKQYRPTL